MPVPSTIADLSTTAASNSPAGTDLPSTLDDHIRALGSFIAYLRDSKQLSMEATLASAATTDIGAAASYAVKITGTTTITSFGTDGQGPRFIRFTGALTLTHNASSLILPGGANITTAAGDTCIAIPIPSGAGWYVSNYRRASTPVNGAVIDRTYGEYSSNANLTTQIPFDNTIPQSTEGTQIISVSFTPKSTTSRVRLRFSGVFALSGASTAAGALFSSASANALAARTKTVSAADSREQMFIEHEYVPGTTSALTYSVRVGPLTGVTMRMNGSSSTSEFGGTEVCTLIVEEIAA
jgi:hypothetical protein